MTLKIPKSWFNLQLIRLVYLKQMKLNEFNVYPNPFGEQTYVSFYLSENETVDLTVYNVIGKVVYTLPQSHMEAGNHKLRIEYTGICSWSLFL